MERAADGEEILITRRGRRFARLGPPDPQLATTSTAPAAEPEADPEEPLPDTARTSRSMIETRPSTCTQASWSQSSE
jgi:antitoxin (DNA-binding transcriptional repressor) of toxin-antitoxin stability system